MLCCMAPVLCHTTVSPARASSVGGSKVQLLGLAGFTSTMSTSWVTGPCRLAVDAASRGVCVMAIGAGGGGGGGGAAPPGTTTRTEATIQGCGVQW